MKTVKELLTAIRDDRAAIPGDDCGGGCGGPWIYCDGDIDDILLPIADQYVLLSDGDDTGYTTSDGALGVAETIRHILAKHRLDDPADEPTEWLLAMRRDGDYRHYLLLWEVA